MEKSIEQATMIPIPIYDYRIYLYFVNDFNGALKKINVKEKIGIDPKRLIDLGSGGGVHLHNKSRPRSYIFLKVGADSNQIVHECYHAISTIFRWIESDHEEEVFAYHLGYLVQQVVSDQKKMLDKARRRVYHVPSVDLPGCN